MQVKISGQHISLGESLLKYTEKRVIDTVSKFFDNAVSAYVHFTKQNHLHICDLVVHEGTGRNVIIKSSASDADIYSSFDIALVKVETQLRKYRSKLKNHSKIKISQIEFTEAVNYVINPHNNETEEEKNHPPVTIAEQPAKIETLTVAEAIMKMDLENIPALMFRNASNMRMNVVYYRSDGNISWVDSKE